MRKLDQNLDHLMKDPDSVTDERYKPYFNDAIEGIKYMRSLPKETLCITSYDGLKLYGDLYTSPSKTNKVIICVHGYKSDGEYDFGGRFKFLESLGWNLLLVDDRAHGKSEGKYIGFSVQDSLDVQKWCALMVERFGEDTKVVLHGISMGGATVLATSGMEDTVPNIAGVIADCGFSSGMDEAIYQLKKWVHLPRFPFLYLSMWWIKVLAHYDLRDNEAKRLISNFKGKLLIVHGGEDDFVPTYMAQEIFDSATCDDKDIMIVDGAYHATSYTVAKKDYEAKLREFFSCL